MQNCRILHRHTHTHMQWRMLQYMYEITLSDKRNVCFQSIFLPATSTYSSIVRAVGIPQLQHREEEEVVGKRGGERGLGRRKGDEAARGGGIVSAHWVWSGQVEECVHACSITKNR